MKRIMLLALPLITLVGCKEFSQSSKVEASPAKTIEEASPAETIEEASPSEAIEDVSGSKPTERKERIYPIIDLSEKSFVSVWGINPEDQYENLTEGTVAKGSHFKGVGIGDGCTSAMIGPNVLLTAAHCVDSGGDQAQNVSFSPRIDTVNPLKYKCTMHPDYVGSDYIDSETPRSSHDIALCLLQNPQDMPVGSSKIFEVIETNKVPKVGDNVLMAGYGCFGIKVVEFYDRFRRRNRYTAGTVGNGDGRLRIGNAAIGETNSHPVFQNNPKYQAYIAAISKSDDKNAKLCKGDSGGPVFSEATVNDPEGKRRVIAVNSSVGALPSDQKPVEIHSQFTDLNEGVVKSFIDKFLRENSAAKICGKTLKPGTNRCRD